ncbi:MAG: flagellar hook-associated protein FlgK [Pantoea sp.]|uniref:Flagellar hook-associated protein 1 n=1 Tax=Pantoea septica TaxID=472695 RepID=A0ABX3UVT7_9GAMM|nr:MULTISPECIES: flagellar hook-associated protein FlgK [Pantoea]MDU5781143.1 flagellar hook-associated protein FlgK [Pantoea sp.]ORN02584.1 flagellar hook-associated protein FlgK [Pantoea septica]
MNLFNIAQSGLSSAQSALNVVGNNINNAFNGDTQDLFVNGYSRRNIVLGEAGGRTTSSGFFGYGVQVNDVARAYNSFISNQVRGAASQYTALNAQYEQLSQIDNMLGDDTNNISVSLGNIFGALEKVSSDPVSPSARQEVLSQFKTIANQFRSNSSTLNGLEKSTNTQISQCVDDINSYTSQLADINQKINKVHGQTGGVPADLLDQRDTLLTKLSELTGIKVDENSTDGTVNVTMTNGMPLVYNGRSYNLETSTDAADPSRTVVSYIDAAGNKMLLDEDRSSEGKLGGLFKFRNNDLVDARNQLNQLALQMANKFNEVNQQGYDLNGEAGKAIFAIDDPTAIANRNNSGDASLSVNYTDISQVQATDYEIAFNGTDWEVTRADGSKVTPTVGNDGSLQFDGISVMPQGTPQKGDSFSLNPVSGAASSISVALTDGDEIAASSSANPDEESNNENIKEMIGIKTQEVIGKSTLSEAYASLASSVGSSASALKGEIETSASVANEFVNQQQAVSGVDLNEEMVNMQMFTQYYQANAQILQTATTLFDTILSIR